MPQCIECHATFETLTRLTDAYPAMRVEWLNIAEQPDMADRYGLLSFEYDLLSPDALAIDGELAGVGHPSEETLRGWLDKSLSEQQVLPRRYSPTKRSTCPPN